MTPPNPESAFVRFLRIHAETIESAIGVTIAGIVLGLLFAWGVGR